MKWITVFEDGKQQSFLRLEEHEVRDLVGILKKPYNEYVKKLEKYQDIQESGEATERQQTILVRTEETVSFMNRIMNNN